MTINEIIGRALLTLDDKYGPGNPFVGHDGHSSDVTLDGHFEFEDIGAAVVKALGEAGYEIVRAPNRMGDPFTNAGLEFRGHAFPDKR